MEEIRNKQYNVNFITRHRTPPPPASGAERAGLP